MNTVVLDTQSLSNLNLIVELAKKLDINVLPISKSERERIEDLKLIDLMVDARNDGLADKSEVLSKLGINA
ncbi:MAG: hypothetical protein LBS01_09485 [Prevotellaceae bacterium]|jgi:hypothetical protein|nr:hypothetical protein [Prevotellaceae bacterium]